ncbi:MAG: hypothetical protein V4436_02025 [Patescibacteria group bacterium]
MARNVKPRGVKSVNARLVAREVIRKTQAGEKIVMGQIVRAIGYSESVVKNPSQVTGTESYIDEIETYSKRLERHRDKILKAMEKKDLDEEEYRTLSEAQAKVTHDVQLLTGGKTENTGGNEDRMTLVAILAEIRGEAAPKIHDGTAENKIEGPAETL